LIREEELSSGQEIRMETHPPLAAWWLGSMSTGRKSWEGWESRIWESRTYVYSSNSCTDYTVLIPRLGSLGSK
jgi:hypothetical protein